MKQMLLIYLTKQMAEEFQSPVIKKVEVWKRIASEMSEKGYDFGAEACDNKFRQLKHRFVWVLVFTFLGWVRLVQLKHLLCLVFLDTGL